MMIYRLRRMIYQACGLDKKIRKQLLSDFLERVTGIEFSGLDALRSVRLCRSPGAAFTSERFDSSTCKRPKEKGTLCVPFFVAKDYLNGAVMRVRKPKSTPFLFFFRQEGFKIHCVLILDGCFPIFFNQKFRKVNIINCGNSNNVVYHIHKFNT